MDEKFHASELSYDELAFWKGIFNSIEEEVTEIEQFGAVDEELAKIEQSVGTYQEHDSRWDLCIGPGDSETPSPWLLGRYFAIGNNKSYFSRNRNWIYENYSMNYNLTAANEDRKFLKINESVCSFEWPRRIVGNNKSLIFHHGYTAGKSTETVWFKDEFRSSEFCVPRPPIRFELERLPEETDVWVICKICAQGRSTHNYNSNHMLNTEPMEDHIGRRMLLNTSWHSHPCSYHTSNLNRAAHNAAAEEPYDDNQRKRSMENFDETYIDIIDHPGFATANIRPISPYQYSSAEFYLLVAIILALTGQAAFTFIGMSGSSTLNCVGAINVVGFIGSLSAMLLRYRLPKVARYLGKVSVIFGAAAVVAVYAARVHPEITWTWGLICGIALLVPSVAVLFA